MKLKLTALLLVLYTGLYAQNKIVLTAPRLDTSSLSNRINLKANTNLNNVNGVLSSTYGGAGDVTGILKANGLGTVSAAVNNADFTLLNGTGFVRMSGTTPSYVTGASSQFVKADGSVDGNTYATTGALSGYLPLSGGTLTGALSGTSLSMSGGAQLATSSGNVLIKTTTESPNNEALQVAGSGLFSGKLNVNVASDIAGTFALAMLGDYAGLRAGTDGSFNVDVYKLGTGYINPFKIANSGAITASSSVTASSLIKSGGTSSQFLMADGSVTAGPFMDLSSNQTAAGNKTFSGKLNVNVASDIAGTFALAMLGDYAGLRAGTDGSFNVDVYKSGTGYINPFKIASTGAITASSSITANGGVIAKGITNDNTAFALDATNSSGSSLFKVRNDGAAIYSSLTGSGIRVVTSSSAGQLSATLLYTTAETASTLAQRDGSGALTATGFVVSSDLRFKDIITQDGDLYQYTLKADEEKKIHYGYIAQEVEKTLPFAVTTNSEGYKAINYIEVHAIKIRELEKQIEELKKLIKK